MPEAKSERSIVSNIMKFANDLPYTKAIKLHGDRYVEAGTPDVLIVQRGVPIFVEVKTKRGVVTAIQKRRLAQWSIVGAETVVVQGGRETVQFLRLLELEKVGYNMIGRSSRPTKNEGDTL